VSEFQRLFEYHLWANERTAASLEGQTGRAVELFAHMGAAGIIWHGRLTANSGAGAIPVWPDWTLAEASRRVQESTRSLLEFSSNPELDLERMVAYSNSGGDRFQNSVREILDHVHLHYHYHRGQIATRVGQAGGKQAATDYIFYLRE
jgi:uncharacterized damage-inducible protein DinB